MKDPIIQSVPGPILITGASGFIGANLLKRLLSEREDVFGAVHSEVNWRLRDTPARNLVKLDVRNPRNVRQLVSQIAPKTIFHLATFGAYPSQHDPEKILATNIQGTSNLITAAKEARVEAFVNAGTSSEYGRNSAGPVEDARREPNSYYGISKSCASDLLVFEKEKNAFPAVNLRLYSVYGALEDSSRLVPQAVRAALQCKYPSFVSPEISRDFVYIDDVVGAFLRAANAVALGLRHVNFNVGTGIRTSMRDFAKTLSNAFDIKGEPSFGVMKARSWDVHEWYSDPRLAEASFGWKANTSLEEGLLKMSDWVSSLAPHEFNRASILHARSAYTHDSFSETSKLPESGNRL